MSMYDVIGNIMLYYFFFVSLIKEWRNTVSNVRPSNSECTRLGEHDGSVRDARGAADCISSCLSALPTIQVRPELDGRMLDIVHCFYNIAKHFSR